MTARTCCTATTASRPRPRRAARWGAGPRPRQVLAPRARSNCRGHGSGPGTGRSTAYAVGLARRGDRRRLGPRAVPDLPAAKAAVVDLRRRLHRGGGVGPGELAVAPREARAGDRDR